MLLFSASSLHCRQVSPAYVPPTFKSASRTVLAGSTLPTALHQPSQAESAVKAHLCAFQTVSCQLQLRLALVEDCTCGSGRPRPSKSSPERRGRLSGTPSSPMADELAWEFDEWELRAHGVGVGALGWGFRTQQACLRFPALIGSFPAGNAAPRNPVGQLLPSAQQRPYLGAHRVRCVCLLPLALNPAHPQLVP